MKKLLTILVIPLMAVFLVAGSAIATPTLFLGVEGTTDYITILDQSADDSNPAVGTVTWIGDLGVFDVNVTTGITKPVIGSSSSPRMDLNSVDVSNGNGTLVIWWSDNDFTLAGNLSGFSSAIGGTTDGTVEAWTLIDQTNGVSTGISQTWTDMLWDEVFTGPAFSGTSVAAIDPAEPFGISLVAAITQNGAGQSTSFDFDVSAIPEPATMLLLGSGLLGLAGLGRKKIFK